MDLTKTYTQEEKRLLLQKAGEEFDSIPGELQQLIAPSNESYLDGLCHSLQVIDKPFAQPSAATTFEKNQLTASEVFERLFAEPLVDSSPLAELERQERERTLEKLVGPSRDSAQDFIDRIVEKVLRKGAAFPLRKSERTGVATFSSVIKAAEVAAQEGDATDEMLAKMLRSFSAGDREAMRSAVREMISGS
jgi:hypothetical protein